MRVALLGGTFNPVHIGHLMVAQYVLEWHYADRVWMMLSPQNPLKGVPGEVSDMQRLDMLRIAVEGHDRLELCDIELSMPRPSYTIDTLQLLEKRYPQKRFKMLIGSDNWHQFDRWRAADQIIDRYGVMVYPRPGYDIDSEQITDANVEFIHSPGIELSSTFIRRALAAGRRIDYFLPPGVYQYIVDNGLYRGQQQ